MTRIEMQAMDAIIGVHRKMKEVNGLDREQRRYEIAEEIFLYKAKVSLDNIKDNMESAVEWVDLLISELKKEK